MFNSQKYIDPPCLQAKRENTEITKIFIRYIKQSMFPEKSANQSFSVGPEGVVEFPKHFSCKITLNSLKYDEFEIKPRIN